MNKGLIRSAVARVLRRSFWLAPLLVLVTVGVVVSALAPAQMLKTIIDDYVLPGQLEGIVGAAFLYLALLAMNSLFNFLKSLTLVLLGQGLYQELQESLSDKLARLATRYYTAHNPGETASYFVNDVDTVNSVFTAGIIGMAIDCFKVIGILATIYSFSATVSLMVCLLLPVMVLLTRIIQKAMLAAQMESRRVTAGINDAISETREVFGMIKLAGREGYMSGRWASLLDENYAAAERVNFASSISSPIPQVIRAAAIAALVWMAGAGVGITIGMLAASIELITGLFDPIEAIISELQDIQKAVSGIRRLNGFYREEEQPEAGNGADWPESMAVAFDHVDFSYTEGRPVLRDVSFAVGEGEAVAIAGRTGVGKTTLMSLITGLYPPTDGAVTVAGRPATDTAGRRREIFAYVSQSFQPVIGTVEDQVTLGDPRVDGDMVAEAVKTVGLHEDILALPLGYGTVYRKGLLSEGQEQLLGIARAIVLKPRIFLLDEMSARLDSLSEERVQQAIETVGKRMTTISISHRLSSMLYAERLVYMKDGAVDRVLDLKSNPGHREWLAQTASMQQYRI